MHLPCNSDFEETTIKLLRDLKVNNKKLINYNQYI